MIFFSGIYYGAMYGGSTTSILLNTPGETASMVTAMEGNKMAKHGRAGAALVARHSGVAGKAQQHRLAFFDLPGGGLDDMRQSARIALLGAVVTRLPQAFIQLRRSHAAAPCPALSTA